MCTPILRTSQFLNVESKVIPCSGSTILNTAPTQTPKVHRDKSSNGLPVAHRHVGPGFIISTNMLAVSNMLEVLAYIMFNKMLSCKHAHRWEEIL